MSSYSHCVECNRRLRNAFFCKHCDEAACSWHCYDKHHSRHAPVRLAPVRSTLPADRPKGKSPPAADHPAGRYAV